MKNPINISMIGKDDLAQEKGRINTMISIQMKSFRMKNINLINFLMISTGTKMTKNIGREKILSMTNNFK